MEYVKYEDLKCEFCDGQGEKEKNIDGMDCPCTCIFCNGSGIDHDQLEILINQSFNVSILTTPDTSSVTLHKKP